MSRRLMGWDLPPGCSHRDLDRAMGGDERALTVIEEAVQELLEKEGLPVKVIDAVAKVLDEYYSQLPGPEEIDPGDDRPLDDMSCEHVWVPAGLGDVCDKCHIHSSERHMPSPQTMAECDCPALWYGKCTYPNCNEASDEVQYDSDDDPTPWCNGCGAMRKSDCHCGPYAENE